VSSQSSAWPRGKVKRGQVNRVLLHSDDLGGQQLTYPQIRTLHTQVGVEALKKAAAALPEV
jgi:hypothetical protein